jgi:hypothetical protein
VLADREEIAAKVGGDGMPLGNELTPLIQDKQVTLPASSAEGILFDDDAAATIVWEDYQRAMAWLDTNSWLAEWQYVDFLYQSPNYDRDWRMQTSRPARISRFNVAKNRNTMSNQVRRGIFADTSPTALEPRGKLAGDPNSERILEAWSAIFEELDDRADFEYNMSLGIECQVLQGTAIWIPIWETKKVKKKSRVRETPPVSIDMPLGGKKEVDTWESDTFKVREETVEESWPYFEYRRLGTTLYSPKWRTPNRPDLTGGARIDIDYVAFEDLKSLRELDCYKDIPSDEDLKTYFLENPLGDAAVGSQVAQSMNQESSTVLHAAGEQRNESANPFEKPLMKLAYWTDKVVIEVLCYESRRKVIRNQEHTMGDQALGYSATWWNIDNSGYGMGTGRLNAGDQRMDQGVLNEVLKMIAFPLNAPILYDSQDGNAPTQNVVMGLGTLWGVRTRDGDVRKAFQFMQMPQIPPEAWKIYQLGKDGGENTVGADSISMQGNVNTPGSSAMRTAAGVNRAGSKADDNIADPVAHLEYTIKRWRAFQRERILEDMPIQEIREILSSRLGASILEEITAEAFIDAEFEIKVLCGQKLAAKAAIMQLIPFFLQIVQQPQLMQWQHEIGQTINFQAIENAFQRMSELQNWQGIFVPMTDEQKQNMAQMNPEAIKAKMAQAVEQAKGQNKLQQIQEQGKQDIQHTLVDKAMDHVSGDVPLELAEVRLERNTDMGELQNGVPGVGE